MDAAADRPEFAPPQAPAAGRGFALAVLAHLLLLYALMHGLHWQRELPDAVAEGPRMAAAKLVSRPSRAAGLPMSKWPQALARLWQVFASRVSNQWLQHSAMRRRSCSRASNSLSCSYRVACRRG